MRDELRLYLESYRELLLEADRLQSTGLGLRERAESTTGHITGMPKGGGDNGGLLAALTEMTIQADRKLAEAVRRKVELEDFVDSVNGAVEREILRLRYIELLRWPEIERRLATLGVYYESRSVYRLHKRALNAARTRWNELKGERNEEDTRCNRSGHGSRGDRLGRQDRG
jgi:hypothetical protein